jgi:hypothetical protein
MVAYMTEDVTSVDVYFVRANGADGSSWQGPELVEASVNFISYSICAAEVNGHPAMAYCGEADNGTETVDSVEYAVYY